MAGIGWKLERLLDRGSLVGAATAYGTGAAVMALPWALTASTLFALRAIARSLGVADDPSLDVVVGTAYAIALVVGAPIQIVVSRHTADRLYERRFGAIGGPLRRALAFTLAATATLAAIALRARGMEPVDVGAGAILAASVGTVWTALAIGNGIGSPILVLAAVSAGFVASVGGGAVLAIATALGARAWMVALVGGQCVTLALLVAGISRSLPDASDEGEPLWPAAREYVLLAGAGLAYNVSLFADEVVVRMGAGPRAAAMQGLASTTAWLSAVPTLAWTYVEVETSFYRRFRALYGALDGGASLAELRTHVAALGRQARALLGGALTVQAISTSAFVLGARRLVDVLGLPPGAVGPIRASFVAAGLQAVMLLGLIVLYYLDRRREAFVSASILAAGTVLATAAALAAGLPPSLAPAAACAVATVVTWRYADRSVRSVLEDTLLDQPFGAEVTGELGR